MAVKIVARLSLLIQTLIFTSILIQVVDKLNPNFQLIIVDYHKAFIELNLF